MPRSCRPDYFGWALKFSRPGTLIIADNVVREGAVVDGASGDTSIQGVRRFNELLAAEPRVSATTIQTVGIKRVRNTRPLTKRCGMRNVFLVVALGIASSALTAQRGAVTVPDAVSADPNHYSVSFENELVRLLRVTYGPGEKSIMHRHPASCAIFLTDQTFNFTLPDGTTEPASVQAGQLGCGDANVHLPQNIEPAAAEFIIIEFKNREAFRK